MIFHPQDPNILVTGSADGLVSFYNISIQDDDEALVKGVLHFGSFSCIHSSTSMIICNNKKIRPYLQK